MAQGINKGYTVYGVRCKVHSMLLFSPIVYDVRPYTVYLTPLTVIYPHP